MNPPSAWAVAKRDAPQIAEQCWTHGFPVGPEGPLRAVPAVLLGHLELRQEQVGGQEPAAHLSQPAAVEKMVAASGGYDLPSFAKLTDLQDLGRGRPAEGHALPLSEPAQPPDAVDRGGAGAAEDRRSRSTRRRIHDQDDACATAGRSDGEDARLGRKRARRLHADLRTCTRRRARRWPRRRAASICRCNRASRREPASMRNARVTREETPWSTRQSSRSSCRRAARKRTSLRNAHAAQVDHRLPDDAAADPADRCCSSSIRRSTRCIWRR